MAEGKTPTLADYILKGYKIIHPDFVVKYEISLEHGHTVKMWCGDLELYAVTSEDSLRSDLEILGEAMTRSVIKAYAEEHSEKAKS